MTGRTNSVWSKLVTHPSGPYDITLAVKIGDELAAPPPYPYLRVVEVELVQARRLVWQMVTVDADDPERAGTGERLRFGRLVAELEGGGEVELDRHALPTEDPAPAADPGTCGACGQRIPQGTAVEHDGGFYHRRCMGG